MRKSSLSGGGQAGSDDSQAAFSETNLSRSGRVRKKSSRLISIEEESANDEQLQQEFHYKASNPKKVKPKLPAALSGPPEPFKTSPARAAIPKLKVKLGPTPSVETMAVPKQANTTHPAIKPLRQTITTKSDPGSPKSQVKKPAKVLKVKVKRSDEKSIVTQRIFGQKNTEKKMVAAAAAATDEDDSEDSYQISEPTVPPQSKEYQRNYFMEAGSSAETGSDNEHPDDLTIDVSDYSPSSDELDEDFSVAMDAVADSGKRQRKKPQKLNDDYVEYVDGSEPPSKASKYFENMKAESRGISGKRKRNRLPSAYTLWCNSYRMKLQAQNPGIDFATMNKRLGEIWWSIPVKEKTIWKRKAKRLATHGLPKTGDGMSLGPRAMQSVKRMHPHSGQVKESTTPGVVHHSSATAFAQLLKPTFIEKTEPTYRITQTEPVDIAAHFMLMSDSLTLIGNGLQAKNTTVQGSLDMLLDALLAGMASLVCLTQQVPELDRNIDPDMHRRSMSNIGYFLPDV